MAIYNKKLGMFELTGLPPAPRNVPQIEVTFDIDANGIVPVGAKDLGTGKEQSMTITGGSALPKDDIDKMIREAEQYAEEDRARRAEAETRNQAESLVYTTERFLAENGDKVEASVKADVEEKLATLRAAVGGTDNNAISEATAELAKASSAMGQALYTQNAAEGGAAGGPADAQDDDVVDAEIVDEEDKK
jgi:molecular chaperone DnaK